MIYRFKPIEMKLKYFSSIITFVKNLLLAYLIYMVCRIVFVWENWGLYGPTLFENNFWTLLKGSLQFDTSAILYTNSLYALMMLFPCHWKEREAWQKAARWVFVVVNSLAVIINLCDAVYVQFTGRRTTTTVFSEFSNEGNLFSIFGTELLRHWYLLLIGILLIKTLCKVSGRPTPNPSLVGRGVDSLTPDISSNDNTGEASVSTPLPTREGQGVGPVGPVGLYYAIHVLSFALYIPLMIAGMRGGFTTAVRPITISNANQYVAHPSDAAVVLNTPFSLIRTIGSTAYPVPEYFEATELDKIYSPIHSPEDLLKVQPADSLISEDKPTSSMTPPFQKKNVVVLIVESFGREFIGAYNQPDSAGFSLEAGYKGYTPFVDSLYQYSLSFDYTFANGRKSIDGMPSVLSSIPMFIEPFVLTPASMNKVSGLAGELGKVGYSSAFFHGAENGSMGFQAFARSTGFQAYYGRDEFNDDKRFRGDEDYDGTWAIWDEPFLQFYALKMTEMKQPFVTAVFTASSHHPFVVPEHYKDIYPEEGDNPLHKCIRYTDHSLQQFFETAKKQPWFENTIFVLTSDHTNMPDHDEYKTDLGLFGAPILFYDPTGQHFAAGRRHCIAEQIDIMPSILGLLGYDRPYVAFGQDLFHTADEDLWAIHYNSGIYQLVKDDWMLQFDGEHIKALYNFKNDWMLQHDILNKYPEVQRQMERLVKAVIQSYMTRMNKDQLVVGSYE